MKTLLITAAAALLCCHALVAETPLSQSNMASAIGTSARDGFTRSDTQILSTKNGVTQRIEKEIMLESGLRVQPDGTVILPGGEKAALRNNQLLTLQGTFEEVALTQDGIAPVTSAAPPMNKQGEEVGISAMDGITLSGSDALVTRNGVSERLNQELRLSDGTRVQPNGTITRPNGAELTLRPTQILSFDGTLRPAPPRPNLRR